MLSYRRNTTPARFSGPVLPGIATVLLSALVVLSTVYLNASAGPAQQVSPALLPDLRLARTADLAPVSHADEVVALRSLERENDLLAERLELRFALSSARLKVSGWQNQEQPLPAGQLHAGSGGLLALNPTRTDHRILRPHFSRGESFARIILPQTPRAVQHTATRIQRDTERSVQFFAYLQRKAPDSRDDSDDASSRFV